MRASTAATAALCLVLGAVLATSCVQATSSQAAAPTPKQKGYLQFAAPGAGYYDRADVKHMRMRETTWGEKYVGCDVGRCGDNSCEDCQTETLLRSNLACCNEDDEDEGSIVSMEPPKIGQCEWHMAWYDCPNAYASAGDCAAEGSIPYTNGYIQTHKNPDCWQIGTAWGTCYLNSDSETCGEPFCGQMVLSIQGTISVVVSYGEDGVVEGNELDSSEWRTMNGGKSKGKDRRRSPLSKKKAAGNKNPTEADKKQAPAVKKQSTLPSEGGKTYSLGVATIFTGPVQVLATGRSFEYTHGLLEYVYDFDFEAFTGDSAVNTAYPPEDAYVYTPYTYTLALVASGGSPADGKEGYGKPEYDEGHNNLEHNGGYKYYDHAQRKH